MERDHLNKLSITFQQQDQCEICWKLAKWFLKNHDSLYVNSTVAIIYNKHKQNGGHLGGSHLGFLICQKGQNPV